MYLIIALKFYLSAQAANYKSCQIIIAVSRASVSDVGARSYMYRNDVAALPSTYVIASFSEHDPTRRAGSVQLEIDPFLQSVAL